ncbi:uncharacterized protein [Asterias amurensis]|uniref:uncharacterized protein n=1 Tax=Asterias amurensis TaxID=7602 RepID=UPI003AB7EFA3
MEANRKLREELRGRRAEGEEGLLIREKELKKRLFEHYALLEEAALEYVRSRRETIQLLESLANELTTHHRNAQFAKISGGAAAILGSGLAIVGFAASFFTLGASIGLLSAGVTVGAVGGLAAIGEVMTKMISSRLTTKKAKQILLQDNNSCKLLVEAIEVVDISYRNLVTTLRVSSGVIGGGKNILNVVNFVADMVEVSSVTLEAAGGVGQSAFKAATAAGKGVAIAGVVLSVVTIPIDFCMIISSAKCLQEKTVPQVAQGICGIVEELACPTEKEIQLSISEMKCRQLNFLLETKTP